MWQDASIYRQISFQEEKKNFCANIELAIGKG
jgi:hypothetical protein